MRTHLKNIRYVVLDEVHELVCNKRGLQLSVGLERLKNLIKESGNEIPQIIALSATIGTPDKVAEFFNMDHNKKLKIVNTVKTKKTSLKVESPRSARSDRELVQRMKVSSDIVARLRRIQDLIHKRRSVLVFSNTREFAEILSSRLTGMPYGAHIIRKFDDWENKAFMGHYVQAIDISAFCPVHEFKKRMDELFADLKSQPKAPGVEEILIPGEPEWRTKGQRESEGCPIREEDVKLLRQLGQELGVSFPA